jgi:hypothetical protein
VGFGILYKKGAKEDKDFLQQTYGVEFAKSLHAWLLHHSEEAESGKYKSSVPVHDFLEAWKRSLADFVDASLAGKLQALLRLIVAKRPPWEFRSATAWFYLLGNIPAEILVVFAVDRDKQVIIYHLVELVDHVVVGHDHEKH